MEWPKVGDFSIEERYQLVSSLSTHEGWTKIAIPIISNRVKTLYTRLIDPSERRKEALPDDYIRGQIAALKWMIEWPDKQLAVLTEMVVHRADEQQKGINGAATAP